MQSKPTGPIVVDVNLFIVETYGEAHASLDMTTPDPEDEELAVAGIREKFFHKTGKNNEPE